MSCNDYRTAADAVPPRFQSLSGFPMSCNIYLDAELPRRVKVSIPIGFSNELQRLFYAADAVPPGFNPYRVSNELQHLPGCRTAPTCQFQSLSGFQ